MANPALSTPKRRMPDLAEFMTTQEAAEKLKLHVMYVRRLVKEGKKLKGVKIGPGWLVSRKSVDDYLKETDGLNKNDPRRGQ